MTHSTYDIRGIVLLNRNLYKKLAASKPSSLVILLFKSLNMQSSKRYSVSFQHNA